MNEALEAGVDQGMRNILDACRRIMLMEPVAGDFNNLAMTEPTGRVKAVALVLTAAAQEHQSVKQLMEERQLMPALFALAKARATGGHLELKTLLGDLPRLSGNREGANHV